MGAEEGSPKVESLAELQFDRVESVAGEQKRACPRCQRAIGDEYFEAEGHMICATCAGELGGGSGGTAWFRALGFGAAAATAGTLAWFLIIKLFSMELGLVAIAVGFLVGIAVRKGSNGRGGWRFQALAMGLTYLSITASYMPMMMDAFDEGAAADQASEQAPVPPGAAKGTAAEDTPDAKPGAGRTLIVFALVFAFALVSPFLGGVSNIMGLIIIGIALYEAWKLNRRVAVSGPFRLAQAALPVLP